MPISKRAYRLSLAAIGTILSVIGGLIGVIAWILHVGMIWGAHQQQVNDLTQTVQRLEQLESVTHPEAARAFGLTDETKESK